MFKKTGLNNIFGKLCQKGNKSQTKIGDENQYSALLLDSTVELTNDVISRSDPNRILMQYKKTEEFVENPIHANLVIASHITAYGRLRLFSLMKKIGLTNVAYCDTGMFT